MKVSRTSRLNGEYQKEISEILRRLKGRNPNLKGLISITEMDVAPDLKTAKVYVSIYCNNEEEKQTSFKALQDCAGQIRHELSQVMKMRTVPALTFHWDGSMTYGAKMDELFKKINAMPKSTDSEDETED